MVLLDVAILLVYMAVEGARGNLVATRVRNRENPDDVLGVSRCKINVCTEAPDSVQQPQWLYSHPA